MFSPAIIVRDLDVVKEVLIKSYANFGENSLPFDRDTVLLGKNPFVLRGQEWKTARQQLATLLTSSKVFYIRKHIKCSCKNFLCLDKSSGTNF